MQGRLLSTLVLLAFTAATAAAADLDVNSLDETALAKQVWNANPDVVAARARLGVLRAARVRAGLPPNPELDASYGNVPVGKVFPTSLDRYRDVPSWELGLSQTVPIGKLGAKSAQAGSELSAGMADYRTLYRDRFFDSLTLLSDLAHAQAKAELLRAQVASGRQLTDIQGALVKAGQAASVTADRAKVDQVRLELALRDAEADLRDLRAHCADLLQSACSTFSDARAAEQWLGKYATGVTPGASQEAPETASFQSELRAGAAETRLGNWERIPDPTFRLGFTRSYFQYSGNEPRTVGATISLPLTIFDHGQADRAEGHARQSAARASLNAFTALRDQRAAALQERHQATLERLRTVEADVLPSLVQLTGRIETAAKTQAIAFSEVLSARRALQDAQLEALDLRQETAHDAIELRRLREVPPAPEGETL